MAVGDERVIIGTTIKAVDCFEMRGRGRMLWAVVNVPHIPFVSALSRPNAQLRVDGLPVKKFEVPHVSGAEALGSFAILKSPSSYYLEVGATVTVVVPEAIATE